MFFAVVQFVGPAAAGFAIGATGGFRLTFIAASLCLRIGALISWRLMRLQPSGQKRAAVSSEPG